MGIPKGDPDTLDYLNNWITTVRNNGFIQKKVNYWWKSVEWESLLQYKNKVDDKYKNLSAVDKYRIEVAYMVHSNWEFPSELVGNAI